MLQSCISVIGCSYLRRKLLEFRKVGMMSSLALLRGGLADKERRLKRQIAKVKRQKQQVQRVVNQSRSMITRLDSDLVALEYDLAEFMASAGVLLAKAEDEVAMAESRFHQQAVAVDQDVPPPEPAEPGIGVDTYALIKRVLVSDDPAPTYESILRNVYRRGNATPISVFRRASEGASGPGESQVITMGEDMDRAVSLHRRKLQAAIPVLQNARARGQSRRRLVRKLLTMSQDPTDWERLLRILQSWGFDV